MAAAAASSSKQRGREQQKPSHYCMHFKFEMCFWLIDRPADSCSVILFGGRRICNTINQTANLQQRFVWFEGWFAAPQQVWTPNKYKVEFPSAQCSWSVLVEPRRVCPQVPSSMCKYFMSAGSLDWIKLNTAPVKRCLLANSPAQLMHRIQKLHRKFKEWKTYLFVTQAGDASWTAKQNSGSQENSEPHLQQIACSAA